MVVEAVFHGVGTAAPWWLARMTVAATNRLATRRNTDV
jgi:hypothetical protein